jgi:cell wall assembly regulator SMI1
VGKVEKLVRALALAAGLGQRPGVLQAVCRKRMFELKQFESGGEPVRSFTPSGVTDAVMTLTNELWDAPEDGVLVIVLRVAATREFEFRYSTGLRSLSPARVVLDQGYRYPGHPLPGMPAPPTAVITDMPTDAGTLNTVGRLVEEYIELYNEIMGRLAQFEAGYSEADVADAERRMGLRLPADVRALYRAVHHDAGEYGLLGKYCLMPLHKVVETYLKNAPGSYGRHDDLFDLAPVVLDSHPAGRVRRISRSDWWVTIASDIEGNYCAVDLDPAGDGTPGQVIEYGRDIIGPVGYVAPSVTALLAEVVEALRAGNFWKPYPDDTRITPGALSSATATWQQCSPSRTTRSRSRRRTSTTAPTWISPRSPRCETCAWSR